MRPRVIALTAAGTAGGAWLVSTASRFASERAMAPDAAVPLRAAVVTAVIVVVTRAVLRPNLLRATRASLRVSAVVGALVGYAVLPGAWRGDAYWAALVSEGGRAGAALDLASWLVVVGLTAWFVARPAAADVPVTYATAAPTHR